MNSKKPVANWISTTLADNIEIKHGYAFKSTFFTDKETDNILLTPGNVEIGGGFKSLKFKYYNGPILEEFVFNKGDIFVAMTDLSKNGDILGYPAKIPCIKGKKFLHNQRLGKVIFKDGSVIAPNYLYWIMRTREYRHHVLSSASGTTVKHTSPDRILSYSLKVPKIPEQILISKILDDLEEKITLNTKINRVLEEIAQAIFKHWFIDFEFPVVLTYPDYIPEETKKELMKYGYKSFGGLPVPEPGKFFVYALECEDGSIYIGKTDFLLRCWHEHVTGKGSEHTRNHKPIRFVYWEKVNSQKEALERERWLKTDLGGKWLEREISNSPMNQGGEMQPSTLGLIPKGFRVGKLSDISTVIMGQSPPGSTYNEEGVGAPFYQGNKDFGFRFPHPRVYCTQPTRFAKKNDILISVRAPIGSLNITPETCAIGRGIAVLRNKSHYGFLYYLLMTKRQFWETLSGEGTVFGSLKKTDLVEMQIVVPNEILIMKFNRIVKPLDELISKKTKEIEKLSELRDILLPKLMSGEIRVPMD